MKIIVCMLIAFLTASPSHGQPQQETRPGVAVDAKGAPVVDPTRNVLDLVAAAIQRQDDLRAAQEKLVQSQLLSLEKVNELHYRNSKEFTNSQATHIEEIARLRSEYEGLLRVAESKRIDAIRLVDVSAAATLAQRTTEQATALATVVTQTAEVLRNQVTRAAEDTRALVASTASTALLNQQQQFQGISTRLAALEQTGAEGKGKQTFQDPAFAELLKEVRSLRESRVSTSATGEGRSDVIAWIVAGLMLLLAVGAFAAAMFKRHP